MDFDYLYQDIHKIVVIRDNISSEEDYTLTIFDNTSKNALKVRLINSADEQESYTANITAELYEEMKKIQNLIIDFEEFPTELKTVLNKMSTSNIVSKLHVSDKVQLGFYKPSELKELTLLEIPFTRTSTEDIILYFKNKVEDLSETHSMTLKVKEMLQKEVSELKRRHKMYIEEVVAHNEQVHTKLNTKINELQSKCDEKDEFFNACVRERELLLERKESLKTDNARFKDLVKDQLSDITRLREGIEYFKCKADGLKQELRIKNASTVPKEKYETLGNVFSSAIADLIKSQIKLYEVISLHDLQKSENKALKEELSKSEKAIKDLQQNFNKNELNLESREITEVTKMIEQLRLQNEAAEKATAMLSKKFETNEENDS